jgi:Na+/H+ antiporter NhaD/arsenite permease-like protein
VVLVLGLALILSCGLSPAVAHAEGGPVSLFGRVTDPQGEPVRGAKVSLVLNGTPLGASAENEQAPPLVESQPDGAFVVDLPTGEVGAIETLVLRISRPHFKSLEWEAEDDEIARLNRGESLRLPDMEMSRRLTAGFWVATLTFVAILVLIALEKLHNTMAALLGMAIMLGVSLVGRPISEELFILDLEQAIEYVDFDVIFLVMGMMIVVGVIEETGIFQWTAYQAYRLSRGRLWLLVVILMLLTSVASALLDNVTTMLLVAPITLQIALTLGVDPLSLLVPEMLASNVGGISTLIGTPNNILIGSYADITFNDFLRNLTPGVLLAQVALTLYVILTYRKEHRAASRAASPALLARLKENARITQPDKLRKAGAIFLGVLVLFVLGEQVHLVPAVTAILGAVAMLLAVRADIEEILRVVDWTTLMFFIALFIVVGAIQEVGLISYIATGIHRLVNGSLVAATLVTVWATGLLCIFIPTIPLTAALLPVVSFLARTLPGASNKVLFYSLSVGSALGANTSLIGATNNMVTAGIAERAGYPISYRGFLKVGFPAAVLTLIVGTLWILIRF